MRCRRAFLQVGTKLLGKEVRIALRLVKKVLQVGPWGGGEGARWLGGDTWRLGYCR